MDFRFPGDRSNHPSLSAWSSLLVHRADQRYGKDWKSKCRRGRGRPRSISAINHPNELRWTSDFHASSIEKFLPLIASGTCARPFCNIRSITAFSWFAVERLLLLFRYLSSAGQWNSVSDRFNSATPFLFLPLWISLETLRSCLIIYLVIQLFYFFSVSRRVKKNISRVK